jgi:two-component system, NtrC family, response regulator GlrR
MGPIEHTQTMTTGFEDLAPARRLVVRVVDGPDRGRFVALGDATLLVGAGELADLPLRDPGVSRRHLEIAVVPGGVRVVDLASKNGTLLRGARLNAALVGVGAELMLGRTTLRIDDADALLDAVESDTLGPLTTRSTPMRRCFGMLSRVAATDIAVLLEGESDTGKDAVARALHLASPRAQRAFREVSLSALKGEACLVALFGRGDAAGAFELAHGGTLFLDDVEATPAPAQAPLVRALESGVVARLGEPRSRRVSVRVVAATSHDLDAEVRAGRILGELRDAVSAVRAPVPPLRDRSADLPEICHHLLEEMGSGATLDDASLARLRAHRFAGNFAELKQMLARAVASAPPGEPLHVLLDAAPASATLRDERDQFERERLVDLLRAHDGNVSAAARAAGFDRRHLHRLLKKHGLRGG